MKASTKRRLENLEKIRPAMQADPVIIFDPKAPRPEHPTPKNMVMIFLPDNGRNPGLI
jgi:hypothetical protein